MTVAIIKLLASASEIFGTLLLSVEAIKLKNLEFIRTHVLNVALRNLNPKIKIVGPRETTYLELRNNQLADAKSVTGRQWFGAFLVFLILVGLGLAYIFASVLGFRFARMWGVLSQVAPHPIWLHVVIVIVAAVIVLWLALIIGLSAYTFLLGLLKRVIAGLRFIEVNTATGVIGSLGFLLFALGAAVKAYLDWVDVK